MNNKHGNKKSKLRKRDSFERPAQTGPKLPAQMDLKHPLSLRFPLFGQLKNSMHKTNF